MDAREREISMKRVNVNSEASETDYVSMPSDDGNDLGEALLPQRKGSHMTQAQVYRLEEADQDSTNAAENNLTARRS